MKQQWDEATCRARIWNACASYCATRDASDREHHHMIAVAFIRKLGIPNGELLLNPDFAY